MKLSIFLSPIILAAIFVPVNIVADENENIENRYPGYKLVFSEEFNEGDKPNTEIWEYEHGFCRNHEDQYYQEDNATLRDGCLVIEARKERVENEFYVRHSSDWKTKDKYAEYTSSSIWAKPDYQFSQGIFEVRAKIPVGTGYWPAIWSTGSKYEWPYNGEIDMMEYYGDAIHANVAWGSWNRWQAQWSSRAPRMSNFAPDFADHFHVWKMFWDDEAIRIYLDDELLNETMLDRTVNPNPGEDWYNVDDYNPYRDPENKQRMWLNFALGGDNGGSLENTPFPAEYFVDYVRIYQPDGIDYLLQYQIGEAKRLLENTEEGDAPGQYSAEVRQALLDAIEEAESHVGSESQEEIDAAVEAIKAAIELYKSSYNLPYEIGSTYRFRHEVTGCYLSNGWFNDNAQVLLLDDNTVEGADSADYNQLFTIVDTPEDAEAEGINIKADGENYVYRNSWNMFYTDQPQLKKKDYIFNIEMYDGHVIIKNEGTGKYVGNDNNWAWSPVYSDKQGPGNEKAYFQMELYDPSGICEINSDSFQSVSAIYNLQGIKISDSIDNLSDNIHGIFIMVKDGKSTKFAR